jgi:protein SCO1/2
MSNRKKLGGLVLILAVPLFILLFLEQFGEQHYHIPTDPAEAEGLSAEVPAGSLGQTFRLPGFLLTARQESFATQSDQARIQVVYFTSANYPDTTKRVIERLTRVQNVFEDEPLVQLLTVVPTRQLSDLTELAQRYQRESEAWMFLADTTQQYTSTQLLPAGTNAATLVLLDRTQHVRGYYDGIQEKEVDRLVAETRILLREAK